MIGDVRRPAFPSQITFASFSRICALLFVGYIFGINSVMAESRTCAGISLLRDREFNDGVAVSGTKPEGPHSYAAAGSGVIMPSLPDASDPRTIDKPREWDLQQWFGLYSLAGIEGKKVLAGSKYGEHANAVKYESKGKFISFGPGNRVVMGIHPSDRGPNRWGKNPLLKSNLILSQRNDRPDQEISLGSYSSIRLKMTARIQKLTLLPEPERKGNFSYNRLYLYVKNMRGRKNETILFIIPIYDYRYYLHPGDTNLFDPLVKKFSYIVKESDYTGGRSFNDLGWITIDKNILPDIKRAIDVAYDTFNQRQLRFVTSRDLSDFVISRFNIQWEVTHPLDIKAEYRDFDLVGTPAGC
jgi:hypothetical protein